MPPGHDGDGQAKAREAVWQALRPGGAGARQQHRDVAVDPQQHPPRVLFARIEMTPEGELALQQRDESSDLPGVAGSVNTIVPEPGPGALWFGAFRNASRVSVMIDETEIISISTSSRRIMAIAADGGLALERPTGLSSIDASGTPLALDHIPSGAKATAFAAGPGSRMWIGTLFSGLVLRDLAAESQFQQLTKAAIH